MTLEAYLLFFSSSYSFSHTTSYSLRHSCAWAVYYHHHFFLRKRSYFITDNTFTNWKLIINFLQFLCNLSLSLDDLLNYNIFFNFVKVRQRTKEEMKNENFVTLTDYNSFWQAYCFLNFSMMNSLKKHWTKE